MRNLSRLLLAAVLLAAAVPGRAAPPKKLKFEPGANTTGGPTGSEATTTFQVLSYTPLYTEDGLLRKLRKDPEQLGDVKTELWPQFAVSSSRFIRDPKTKEIIYRYVKSEDMQVEGWVEAKLIKEKAGYTYANPNKRPEDNAIEGRFLQIVKSFEGTPYKWGGTQKGTGVDCSGLVWAALYELGCKNVPRTADEQHKAVAAKGAKPDKIAKGNLIFWERADGKKGPGVKDDPNRATLKPTLAKDTPAAKGPADVKEEGDAPAGAGGKRVYHVAVYSDPNVCEAARTGTNVNCERTVDQRLGVGAAQLTQGAAAGGKTIYFGDILKAVCSAK